MRFLIIVVSSLAFSSCARQFHYSSGEAGRVAAYFRMEESEVGRIYADNAFSWPPTIRELIEKKVLTEGAGPDELSSRFDEETEKIMKECRLK